MNDLESAVRSALEKYWTTIPPEARDSELKKCYIRVGDLREIERLLKEKRPDD